MHKFVAGLLLALIAAVLFSSPHSASSHQQQDTALLTARVMSATGLMEQHQVNAHVSDYFDFGLRGDVLLSIRLSALDAGTAEIEAVVARDGLTLSEPSLHVARNGSASLELSDPPLTLQFEVR